MAPKLNVIIGSTRPGRVGPPVAKWISDLAVAHGKFDVELVDLADFKLPLLDEPDHPSRQQYQHAHTKRWAESVASADAFVFVTPEYDYFPPASLVNAIQYLLREWSYKAAGVVSYGGVSGGLRSTQMLRGLLGNLNAVAITQSVPISFVSKFIGEDGAFHPSEQTAAGAAVMLDELHKWTGALQTLRPPVVAAQAAA
jgi:NAD(P)H-dependent FMN reductase